MDENQNYVDYIGIISMTSTLHIKFGGGERESNPRPKAVPYETSTAYLVE